ncbi:MAG: SagB/ThcOx family dehydrogenase [Ignisphaera sp.]
MDEVKDLLETIIRIGNELEGKSSLIPSLLRTYRPSKDFKIVKECNSGLIQLPSASRKHLRTSLFDVIANRRSRRNFSKEGFIYLDELAAIVYASVGTTKTVDGIYGMKSYPLRASPSTGGLNCVDLVVAYSVRDLDPGIYYYNYRDHVLCKVCIPCFSYILVHEAITQSMFVDSAVVIVFVANLCRGLWKYGIRFYKYCLIDIGIAAENAHLACTVASLLSTMVAGFDKHKVAKINIRLQNFTTRELRATSLILVVGGHE